MLVQIADRQLNEFRFVDGWLWPKHDRECAEAIFGWERNNWAQVISMTPRKRVAVQAGGNCGVLPRLLSDHFHRVVTFEPDPVNFTCLSYNTIKCPHVTSIRAALGSPHYSGSKWGSIKVDPVNVGAGQVSLDNLQGDFPIMALDDLRLTDVDLIYLDVEGMEAQAIDGARQTIMASMPVVVFEEKGLGTKYSTGRGNAEDLLVNLGYKSIAKFNNDVVMCPK